jgi:O2-independent ubiquinone biosynthesis protein UbiU
MDLVVPAGNLPSLKKAVDNGADSVYIGFADDTNARHFAGLNFKDKKAYDAISYAHNKGVCVFVAINTYPQPARFKSWTDAVDLAVDLGVDAVILADMGVMEYAKTKYPDLNLHLSVQGSATTAEAINFYHKNFNIKRVVIPRVLSVQQVENLIKKSKVPIETFGFGSLCVMVEGRCILSSYVTGQSPNTFGACSPASFVEYKETKNETQTRLNGVLIDKFSEDEKVGYPTICKGRFEVSDNTYYALEEPTSLNVLDILPKLYKIGVSAIKVEGRQRSPAYIAAVTKVWREAIDTVKKTKENFDIKENWRKELQKISEGTSTTLGAYHRGWQ